MNFTVCDDVKLNQARGGWSSEKMLECYMQNQQSNPKNAQRIYADMSADEATKINAYLHRRY